MLRSQFKRSFFIGISILACSFWALAGMLFFTRSHVLYYSVIQETMTMVVFILFGVAAACYLFTRREYIFHHDSFEWKYFWKNDSRIVYYHDIIGCREYHSKEKEEDKRTHILTIFVGKDKYKLSSGVYQNYTEIAAFIKEGRERAYEEPKYFSKENYVSLICSFLIVVCFGWLLYNATTSRPSSKAYDFVKIQGHMEDDPEIHKPSKGSPYVSISFTEYPGYDFDLKDESYDRAKTDALVDEIRKGDLVTIEVEQSEHDSKLLVRKKKGSYVWSGETHLDVYSLATEKATYLNIPSAVRAEEINSDRRFAEVYLPMILSFVFFMGAAGYFHNYKEKALGTDPENE